MTFDELSRRDLRRKRALLSSTSEPQDAEIYEGAPVNGSVFIDPDSAEVNRFLDWLEKNSHLGDAGEHSRKK
jgi:hypothetical protein